jgi:threonine aldolase
MPQTNIVFFDVTRPGVDAKEFCARCRQAGLDLSNLHGRIRAVTHLDVSRADIERAIAIVRKVLK